MPGYNELIGADIGLAVLIVLFAVLFIYGKLDRNRTYSTLIAIPAIPIVVFLTLLGGLWLYAFSFMQLAYLPGSLTWLIVIGSAFIIEMLIVFFYLVCKCNFNVYSALSKNTDAPKALIQIDRSRKVLNYSIYGIITNALYTMAVVVFFSTLMYLFYKMSIIDSYIRLAFSIPPLEFLKFLLIFLVAPFYFTWFLIGALVVEGILLTCMQILLTIYICICYLLLINGTMRAAFAFRFKWYKKLLYFICSFIPPVNLINAVLLSRKARKALQAEGCKVGIFGVKEMKV
jgi:hypothetical protein